MKLLQIFMIILRGFPKEKNKILPWLILTIIGLIGIVTWRISTYEDQVNQCYRTQQGVMVYEHGVECPDYWLFEEAIMDTADEFPGCYFFGLEIHLETVVLQEDIRELTRRHCQSDLQ